MIEAIKAYREQTGCGLKDASDQVHSYLATIKDRQLERPSQLLDDLSLPPLSPFVMKFVQQGNREEAVQLYQQQSGTTRKQSEVKIDFYAATMNL